MTVRIKRIFAWIAFGLGTLIIAFFRHYKGDVIPYPDLIWISGIACYICGIFLLIRIPKASEIKSQKSMQALVAELKQNGNKVQVNLDDCDLIENNYFEEKNQKFRENATGIEMWVASRYSNPAVTDEPADIEILQSRAAYKINYAGKERTFYSPIMAKDRDTILFKFFAQKTTTIYIDKNNPENYYFDVEFMDQ